MSEKVDISDKALVLNIDCEGDIKILSNILDIYNSINMHNRPEKVLKPYQLRLLSLYIRKGYSKETMDEFKESYNRNDGYVNVINSELRNKGFLIKDDYKKNNYLSSEMEDIKKSIIDKKLGLVILNISER